MMLGLHISNDFHEILFVNLGLNIPIIDSIGFITTEIRRNIIKNPNNFLSSSASAAGWLAGCILYTLS
jgi:hypothetical protein